MVYAVGADGVCVCEFQSKTSTWYTLLSLMLVFICNVHCPLIILCDAQMLDFIK
jgi:hypothetical protein